MGFKPVEESETGGVLGTHWSERKSPCPMSKDENPHNADWDKDSRVGFYVCKVCNYAMGVVTLS
jgi:hypothetical protein